MFWWLLVACPKRAPDTAVRRDQLLKQADAAWERRGQIGLEEASLPLLEAHGLAPTHPGVLWRIARWRTSEGMAAEDPAIARASYAEARATGASCLEQQSGFAQTRQAEGWAAALTQLTADRAPCVVWTAFPWVRWMELQGGQAAALDLEPLDALLGRVTEGGNREFHGTSLWGQGLLYAVRPTWSGRDLTVARARLQEAVDLDRGSIVRLVDLYRVVLESGTPAEQTELRRRILALEATTPEDVRARATLEAEAAPADGAPADGAPAE